MINVSPSDWLELGLLFAGFTVKRQNVRKKTNLRRFVAHYGAHPETLTAIFHDLQATTIADARIPKPDVKRFMMAFYWLQCYPVEEQSSGMFDFDETTVRTHVWRYVRAIAALKGLKVRTLCCNPSSFCTFTYLQHLFL
jgi:hypothetical protein